MKKYLSILAAVGLTATASSAVVACSTTISAKNATVAQDGTMTIKGQKIELVKEVKKDGKIDANDYKLFDKDGKALTGNSSIVSIFLSDNNGVAKKDLKAKSNQKVDITIKLDTTDFKADKTGNKIELGSIKDDKVDVKSTTIKFDTPKEWKTSNTGGETPAENKATLGTVASTDDQTFTITLTDGTSVKNADLAGKVTVKNGDTDLKDTNAVKSANVDADGTTLTVKMTTAIAKTDAKQTISFSVTNDGWATTAATFEIEANTPAATSVTLGTVASTDDQTFTITLTDGTSVKNADLAGKVTVKNGDTDLKDTNAVKSANVDADGTILTVKMTTAIVKTAAKQTISFSVNNDGWATTAVTFDIPANA